MMISTRGRYALSVMIDLAKHNNGEYISLKEISERNNISMKYLESIVSLLNRGDMLLSLRGKNGGYKLKNKPSEYSVGSILKLTEGSLSPVSCVGEGEHQCQNFETCPTYPVWKELDRRINDYLESVSLGDILENKNTDK
ncbi:MAG: RrF2 family transcriptional regulator [Acutalibacteraceae bacterium]